MEWARDAHLRHQGARNGSAVDRNSSPFGTGGWNLASVFDPCVREKHYDAVGAALLTADASVGPGTMSVTAAMAVVVALMLGMNLFAGRVLQGGNNIDLAVLEIVVDVETHDCEQVHHQNYDSHMLHPWQRYEISCTAQKKEPVEMISPVLS